MDLSKKIGAMDCEKRILININIFSILCMKIYLFDESNFAIVHLRL